MSKDFPHPFQSETDSAAHQVPVKISDYFLWCALTAAFEGGSNYWIDHVEVSKRAPGAKYASDHPFLGGELRIVLQNPEDVEVVHPVTLQTLLTGAAVMAEKYPHMFKDLVGDSGDALTGDALLQCAIFGEAVYG